MSNQHGQNPPPPLPSLACPAADIAASEPPALLDADGIDAKRHPHPCPLPDPPDDAGLQAGQEPLLAAETSRQPAEDGAGRLAAAEKSEPRVLPTSLIATLTQLGHTRELTDLAARAAQYATRASGPGTLAAYKSAWRGYTAWCATHDYAPLSGDPGLIALYLTARAEAGRAVSTLQVARAAIRTAHRLAGVPLDLDDARLAMVMEGITRTNGRRPRRQAAPAVPDVLKRLLAVVPSPVTPAAAAPALAARHRAMLLIGFGAALRRAEIVALRIGDIAAETRGLMVRVRRSKTDQQGQGRSLAIWANHGDPVFCPVAAYEAWLRFRAGAADWNPPGSGTADPPALTQDTRRSERPLFCGVTLGGSLTGTPMSEKIVNRTLKQACRLAGLDAERFSGHSLRRGLLTDAGHRQMPLIDVMRQSRHTSVETALTYLEAGDAWRNNITEPVFRLRQKED